MLGIADDRVLRFPVGQGRIVLTRNRWDFIRLHRRSRDRPGITVCWENDWGDECPLEVIELKDEIERLRGWGRND